MASYTTSSKNSTLESILPRMVQILGSSVSREKTVTNELMRLCKNISYYTTKHSKIKNPRSIINKSLMHNLRIPLENRSSILSALFGNDVECDLSPGILTHIYSHTN